MMNDFFSYEENRRKFMDFMYHVFNFTFDYIRWGGLHIDNAYAHGRLPNWFDPPNDPSIGRDNSFRQAGGGPNSDGGPSLMDTSASGLGNINSHGTYFCHYFNGYHF